LCVWVVIAPTHSRSRPARGGGTGPSGRRVKAAHRATGRLGARVLERPR